MLVTLQIPLADARCFLEVETHRLKTPAWPIPEAYREFVRGFGGVAKRLSGGLEEWRGEGVFCGAARAVRFQVIPDKIPEHSRRLFSISRPAFRRFLFDGNSVARFEAGVTRRHEAGAGLGSGECSDLLRALLTADVHIPASLKTQLLTSELAMCGDALAGHYLRATTQRKGEMPQVSPWWVKAGEPQLVVEYRHSEISSFPAYTRRIETSVSKDIHLSYGHVAHRGRMIGAWYIGAPDEGSPETRDQLRRLRIHLSRLHSERQCLKQILRLISKGKIQPQHGTAASDRLQQYIQNAVAQLSRQSRFGLPQSELLNAAFEVENTVNEGERATLLAQLAEVRRNVLRTVSDYTSPASRAPGEGVAVFLSYAHEDEALCNELRKHLAVLQHLKVVSIWHDRKIMAGSDWATEIDARVDQAQLVLLLITSDFLDSEYCVGIEMARAMERRAAGQAVVVPVILRSCAWQLDRELAKLQAVPKDGNPVTSWSNTDEAFTDIAQSISTLLNQPAAVRSAGIA